jgi:hypothetical protein
MPESTLSQVPIRARDKWLAAQSAELPVPYCHVVFTLPQELSQLALQNQRVVYSMLFRAVSETLLTIAADPRRLGAHIGFLSVLHTWNQKILHHPHLHCLIPAGGLSLDRSRWVRCRRRFFLPVKVLGSLFRGKFLAFLAAAYRRKNLHLLGSLAYLKDPTEFERFRPMAYPQLARLCQAPIGRPGAGHQVPLSLHPSRRHFERAFVGNAGAKWSSAEGTQLTTISRNG